MESETMDDSLCILYEKIMPKPEIEIVNEISGHNSEENVPQEQQSFIDICQDSPRRAAGVSQSNRVDGSICMLQEIKKSQPVILGINSNSSKDAEKVSPPPRNKKKTKIECGICFEGLIEILDSDRTLGSTVCGHIFCNVCMEASRKNSAQCPTCRKRLGKTQFHPIYF